MIFYGRTDGTEDKLNWQTVKEHLESVAKLTGTFAAQFNSYELGYMTGLLHDIGKYSEEFQQRLENKKLRVEHSTAGAKLAYELYKNFGLLMAYPIAGHHRGLPDYDTIEKDSALEARLKRITIPPYEQYKQDISGFAPLSSLKLPIKNQSGFGIAFYIRMLFSCLVDADSLDAESASGDENASYRGIDYNLAAMEKKLSAYLEAKTKGAEKTQVNKYRQEILSNCIDKADKPTGLFSLTVPTGGGKTLSSLAFALRHAVRNGLNRIIYVIPYTSIIEQNAGVFREVLGDKYVLEHHSNYQYPDRPQDWEEDIKRLQLAAQNWDAPIVVTTNVQFFESLFSSKRSTCRKLHNLSRSVIILDEAQMLPSEYLRPCLAALNELVVNYNASILLCTATQPAINKFLPGNIQPIELINQPESLYESLKRVDSKFLGYMPDDELSAKLRQERQTLCIVNTRKHAQLLYNELEGTPGLYHLSARMCPVHRKTILFEIKAALRAGEPCVVISTQLIEAGVDVDFPSVFRAAAGIDSIAQAAGRSNREGKLERGTLNIFIPEKHGMPAGWISKTAEIGRLILQEFEDPLSLGATKKYFEQLYMIEGDEQLDRKNILGMIKEGEGRLAFPFEEISNEFRIIDEDMVSVIIPWDERAKDILKEMRKGYSSGSCGRMLQAYVVQVYKHEFSSLLNAGAIENIEGTFNVLCNSDLYSEETGLLMPNGISATTDILIF